MYDGGLENWQIGMAVNLSRHTISKRLTHLRKLGLIDDERGKHTPSERLVQSVDATNTQLTLGVWDDWVCDWRRWFERIVFG